MLIFVEKGRNVKSKSAKLLRVVELDTVSGSIGGVSNLCVMECISDVIAHCVL